MSVVTGLPGVRQTGGKKVDSQRSVGRVRSLHYQVVRGTVNWNWKKGAGWHHPGQSARPETTKSGPCAAGTSPGIANHLKKNPQSAPCPDSSPVDPTLTRRELSTRTVAVINPKLHRMAAQIESSDIREHRKRCIECANAKMKPQFREQGNLWKMVVESETRLN